MDAKKFLFFAALLMMSVSMQGQRRMWNGDYNRLGIKAGGNYFNILTDDLPIEPKVSWTAGFTARASFYNNFQFIYGINFYDFKIQMSGREKLATDSEKYMIDYNMIGVQASFLGSYKLYDHYLSVEAGPVVQINGKLDARQDKDYYYIEGYDLQAIDIEKITPFSVNLAAGISGGMEAVKFWAQYQHGVNNILSGLNDNGLEDIDSDVPEFSGNMSMIAAGVVFFL